MTERKLRIWYNSEGDYLEVIFDQKPRYFRETKSDQVMEKVDEQVSAFPCCASSP